MADDGNEEQILRQAIFGLAGTLRFTQDSPVLPDVWWSFSQLDPRTGRRRRPNPDLRIPLLLTPNRRGGTMLLLQQVRRQFEQSSGASVATPDDLAYNEAYVKGSFTFEDLVCRLLPLTKWYQEYLWRGARPRSGNRPRFPRARLIQALQRPPGCERDTDDVPSDLVWLVRCAGSIELLCRDAFPDSAPWDGGREAPRVAATIVDAFGQLLGRTVFPTDPQPVLWRVNCNRAGALAIWRSRQTVKADAAERTYELDCSRLRWAVIDSGIDATHPAFGRRNPDGTLMPPPSKDEPGSFAKRTRVVETYDFGKLAELYREAARLPTDPAAHRAALDAMPDRPRAELLQSLSAGRSMPWDLLQSFLLCSDADYQVPEGLGEFDHGTHVAGVLAADWRKEEQGAKGEHDIRGLCPTLELVDIRVRDREGRWDEFTVITALQLVRFLNQHADRPVIQGVNVSLQFPGDPVSFAAGHTPICEECDRLVNSGVVVVVAAGNSGFEYLFTAANPRTPWFSSICIGDPGTTESVITVGATHRDSPHTYGVSYFSSRGPTPDGRPKPDLLAPGEKIVAPVPNKGLMAKDGTSMAAPHVSGAAALLMARNAEFVGRPAAIKRILMQTATDLGRERHFQGAGLVDILRALGSV